MGTDKAQLRSAGMFEVGAKLDDMLEAARKEAHKAEGAIAVAEKAQQRVLQLTTTVDKDLDGGAFDIDTAKTIKSYLTKAHAAMADLSKEAQKTELLAKGMVLGMAKSVQMTKVLRDLELGKTEGDEEPEPGEARRTGGRPKMGIKERRQAEEAAGKPASPKKASKKASKKRPAKAAKR